MPTVSVNVAGPRGFRGPMHVRVDGAANGPVLLLLHGFSGSLEWFDTVVPMLADTFRLVRVDLLGHGATGGPAVDAPLQAKAVEEVLAQLDVDRVTAVGHSFGADVAVELAEKSRRVERLVVVTQAPDYSQANLPRGNQVMTLPFLGFALHRIGQGLFAFLTMVRRSPATDRELTMRALRDFRALHSGMFRVVLVDRRNRMVSRPLDEQIRASGKPTLVILGGRDHFYGDRSADRYAAVGARVHVLPESDHSPFVQLPQESADLIRAFALD